MHPTGPIAQGVGAAQQIGQQLYVDKYRALFDELRKASTIDIPDAALADQVNQQFGPAQ